MRIAVFHDLPSGGAKRALYEWMRRLTNGHELDVYTLSTAEHQVFDVRAFTRQHHILDFHPCRLFQKRPWGRLNPLQRWRDLGELERMARRIAHEIDSDNYDVVFSHPCLYTLMPIVPKFLETPSLHYLHEPFGPAFNRQCERPYSKISRAAEWSKRFDPFVALYRHRLERLRIGSMRRTTRFLSNSEFTRQQIKLAYDVDAPVCRYGVDTEDFHPMPGVHKENSVISVGELSPRKGFDFVIESLARIPLDRRPALRLACNTEIPSERQYLESLATQYAVDLQILPQLDTRRLALEYNRAQLCVYAPVLEPLGLVPLEAMACGTPVIGVAEGGVLETVQHGETGLLTERDPDQFADAILRVLGNSSLAKELAARAMASVRDHWSWDASVACLEAHLRQTAGRHAR